MGRSGLEVHSWTMQSLSSCWMLCFCTYCSHSLRLRSSSLLVLPDAMTTAVTPALRPLAFDLVGMEGRRGSGQVAWRENMSVLSDHPRDTHVYLLSADQRERRANVCRDATQGDGKCEKSRGSVRTRRAQSAASAYCPGVSVRSHMCDRR